MKKQAVNTFDGGMVTDIDELHAKSNTLTYAKNTEYLTTEGNQLILQKREGRSINASASVSPGFNIKAVKVIDDIAYIVSTSTPGEVTGNIVDIQFNTEIQERSFVGENVYRGQLFNMVDFENPKVTGASFYIKKESSGAVFSLQAKLFGVDSIDSNGFTVNYTLLGQSNTISSSSISTNYDYVTLTFPSEINVSAYQQVIVAMYTTDSGEASIQYTDNEGVYSDGHMVYGSSITGSVAINTDNKAYKCRLIGSHTPLGESELGTFPSPDYSDPTASVVDGDIVVPMVQKYSPLMNFSTTSSDQDEDYNSIFRTVELGIRVDDHVELELQKTYDGSINMVFASTDNPVRLINTKFKPNGDGFATLIKRRLDKNDNVYSADNFQKTEIIPRATTVGYIDSIEIKEGGSLPAGGYRYYIKYITADGVETDVVEESRTIDIHYSSSVNKTTGGATGEVMPKMVKLTLKDLDKAFKGIRVYFSVSAGDVAASTQLYQILNTYDINSAGEATVLHTGFESTEDADQATFALSYSQVKNSKIITKVNNRLALSGSSISLNHKEEYIKLASHFIVRTNIDVNGIEASTRIDGTDITDKTHANPETFYTSGEYWDGETYELGVVFITPEGSTPVYPIHGKDDLKGGNINLNLVGIPDLDFDPTTGQNSKGIHRTASVNDFFRVNGYSEIMTFTTTHLEIVTSYFKDELSNNPLDYSDIIGYYFVRKKRKKDVQMRGILTPTIALPQVTTFGFTEMLYTPVFWNGGRPGIDPILYGGYKRVPYPDCIMPYACRRMRTDPNSGDNFENRLFDFQVRSVIHPAGPEYSFKSSFAFYSPDIDCNSTYAASAFSARDFGTHIYRLSYMNSDSIQKVNTGTNYNKAGVYVQNRWVGPAVYGAGIEKERFAVGTLSLITEDTLGAGSGAFAGSTDRNLWFYQHAGQNSGYDITGLENSEIRSKSTANIKWYDGDVDDDNAEIGGNALKYGRYVGINYKAEDYIRDIDLLDMHMLHKGLSGGENINLDFTLAADGSTSSSSMPTYFDPNEITGFLCTVYTGVNTSPISFTNWKEKYSSDDNSAYFAISRRYAIDTADDVIPLGDGDCYSGLAWKRVYRPRGIDEAPQATDTAAYGEDYRDMGMADFGYAISIPTKSNYNFHLRVPSNLNEGEYELFGQKRSFLPVQGIDAVRGSKLDETDKFNHGYGASHESSVPLYRLNPDSPYYKAEQYNRVYVSDTDIESNFVNGFTQFKGLSYRDYNSELGPINTMVTLKDKIVAIFDSGVSTIGVDERSMIPGSDGNIFMDSAKALASKSEVKSTTLGSNQPTSVVVTEGYVYGVDTKQYKIWRTSGEEFTSISDLRVQSWIKETIQDIGNDPSASFTVYTTYDARKSEILFTFSQNNKTSGELIESRTIVYNELLDIWVCETDEHRTTMFYIDENKFASRPYFENSVYEYGNSNYVNELNGEPVENTILEFVINKDQNEVKVLENLMIVGNSVIPDIIGYSSDIYKRRHNVPILQQDLITRTPVVIQIKDSVSVTRLDVYRLRFNDVGIGSINNPITRLPVDVGELVTIGKSNGDLIRTKIIAITDDGLDVDFADEVPLDSTIDLYLGHKSGYRQYNAEIHEGITYLIPSCELNSDITQPRGKWIKARMELDGADQMYISGIASVYNQSLS